MKQNIENHAGYLIQQISHALAQLYNKNLANEDLSISHARVIYLLYQNDGLTQTELQQDLAIKPSSITKLIDVLVEKGLVQRQTSTEDARSRKIYLTAAGRKKEENLCRIRETTEAHLLHALPVEEQQTLLRLLKTLRTTID